MSQQNPDDLFRCMNKFQHHLKLISNPRYTILKFNFFFFRWKNCIYSNYYYIIIRYYLLVSASGMVSRQTPFLNSIIYFSSFANATSFLYHLTNGCGSHCTIHSNRALCPHTTAISFKGCKKKKKMEKKKERKNYPKWKWNHQNVIFVAFIKIHLKKSLKNLPL